MNDYKEVCACLESKSPSSTKMGVAHFKYIGKKAGISACFTTVCPQQPPHSSMTQGLSAFLPTCLQPPFPPPSLDLCCQSTLPDSKDDKLPPWDKGLRHFIKGGNILWPLPCLWYFPLITVAFTDPFHVCPLICTIVSLC